MKLLVLAITVLTCDLLSLTQARLLIQPRCRCTETVQTYIPNDRIVKMEKFRPGPHCKNVEIIATVKYRKEIKLCLNPNVKWVQDALKRRNLAQ